jgi:molybdenum cofactor biosynthesis enzyme
MQKRVMITCVLGNSSNENFNAFQCIIGFFCDSKCTPEVISEMMAHMGVSVSLSTTWNMVKSLQKTCECTVKDLTRRQYDLRQL